MLIAVLSSRGSPFPSLARTSKLTWASERIAGVSVLFYFGGRELRARERELVLPIAEEAALVGYRTLACFEYALQWHSPDVVFRANASSYVDQRNIGAFVREHVPRTAFYGGNIGDHDGIRFASGSGYFLTRDLVQLVLDRRSEWDHSLIDDVALGELLARHGIEPQPVPRQDLVEERDLAHLDLSHFHFRCKSGFGPIREDRIVMLEIHRAFGRARSAPFAARVRVELVLRLARAERSLRWRLSGVRRWRRRRSSR